MSNTLANSPSLPQSENGTPAISQDTPSDPVSPIQNQKSKLRNFPRRRRGRVARLPKPLRDQINQLLDDGLSYSAVRHQLADHGKSLNNRDIGRWKAGGYQDHLRELRLLDESRARFELTLDLARQEQGIDVFHAAHKIAAGLIAEAVAEIGADALRQAIKANPLNLLRMLNSLSRLTAGGIKCERHLADQAHRHSGQNDPNPESKQKVVTKGSIEEMQDALHLM